MINKQFCGTIFVSKYLRKWMIFMNNKNNLSEDRFVINKRILGREVCNFSINSLNCRLRGGVHFLEISLTVAYNNQSGTVRRKSSDSALENVKHLVTEVERISVN